VPLTIVYRSRRRPYCFISFLLQVSNADIKDNIPSACSPKVQEFIVSFRCLDTAKHRYKYLSLHGAEHIGNTFRNEEIPPSVLVELLETLLIFSSNSVADIITVTRLLDIIAGTKRYRRTRFCYFVILFDLFQ